MANGFSIGTAFEDVIGAIRSGTFDPQGSNFTDFMPKAAPVAAQSQGEVLSVEKAKTVSVGTETYTQTETKENRVNTDLVSSWLVRIAVVLLGFIFVAVGLAMFKPQQKIDVVMKAVKP